MQEILNLVKETLIKINPDYDIVMKWLHLYYNMKLVTFGVDKKKTFDKTISNIHTTTYTTTINIILIINSSSTN